MIFKISKSIFQLLLLVALISCKQEKQTAENLAGKAKEIIQLDLDDVANNASKASVIVKNIEYIPLESPPGAMVGEVTDIQFTDGKYYIMDRLSNSIFVFSQNGEFKSKIAAIGKAEGEYINISAFTVIPKSNKICIYDARLKKIIFYDSTGKFEREIKTDVLITDLAFPSDSVAHIYTAFFPNIVNLDKTELNRLYTNSVLNDKKEKGGF